jgi:ABC-type multidrug transport system fused ATPase/permease subunit
MNPLLCILSVSLFFIGLYRVAHAALGLPDRKASDSVRNIHGRRKLSARMQEMMLPLARLISRMIPMGEYKMRRMEADFARLHIETTPQVYVSTAIARSLLLMLIGLLFIPLGIPWLALLAAAAAVLSYFQSTQAIRKKVEAQNRAIEAELPRLVETLGYSLLENRDMIAFFEKYRSVSGKTLGLELDRLIVEMKTGNPEAALRGLDARLGLPSFSALCAVLCGVHQGVDQQTSLLVLEQDMRAREREMLRRSLAKLPGRIKAASFLLTILMILMFMVPLILLIINNLLTVGF